MCMWRERSKHGKLIEKHTRAPKHIYINTLPCKIHSDCPLSSTNKSLVICQHYNTPSILTWYCIFLWKEPDWEGEENAKFIPITKNCDMNPQARRSSCFLNPSLEAPKPLALYGRIWKINLRVSWSLRRLMLKCCQAPNQLGLFKSCSLKVCHSSKADKQLIKESNGLERTPNTQN